VHNLESIMAAYYLVAKLRGVRSAVTFESKIPD
jgi:hypothetical protein